MYKVQFSSSLLVPQVPFYSRFSAIFLFVYFCAFGVVLLFTVKPQHCLVFLSAGWFWCAFQKIVMLDKLHQARLGAVSCQFSVNESTENEVRCLSTEAHVKQGFVLLVDEK